MTAVNQLSTRRRAQIVSALVEGNSVRATCRLTGTAKGTVLKLLADLGVGCAAYSDAILRELPCERIQADEIWNFCYAKDKNVPKERKDEPGVGSVWTWTAICADTKLVPSWMVGKRDGPTAHAFMQDLASRLANRVQLTTDGYRVYLEAVDGAFGTDIDYAMLIKLFGADPSPEARYSPPKCTGTRRQKICGDPNAKHVSTSYAERLNLTLRMGSRRFTRLTNAFSKKIDNLEHAVALHFTHYNFARIHQTLRVTPAMAAGVTDHPWELEELVENAFSAI